MPRFVRSFTGYDVDACLVAKTEVDAAPIRSEAAETERPSDLQTSRCDSDGRNGSGSDVVRSLDSNRVGRARRLRRLYQQGHPNTLRLAICLSREDRSRP
jgi:hypothetical protein